MMRRRMKHSTGQQGFTLIEAMIAMVVLSFGILGLAVVYAQGIQYANTAQMDYIAGQKAQEAVESIFAARNAEQLSWAQIQNTTSCTGAICGVFLTGGQPLLSPGPDGVVGTADDDAANPDKVIQNPGNDGKMGTVDDAIWVLSGPMNRTILIQDLPGEANLRQITVTVNFQVGGYARQYTLVTYISAFA